MNQEPDPVTHRLSAGGLSLAYADWGNADAPTLLLLHGGRDHCRNWDFVAPALRHDWHIVAPDLRGHGDSDWSPDGDYRSGAFIFDLAAFFDHFGPAPISIIGHSLGGNIALAATALFPGAVCRLAIIEGLGFSPKLMRAREEKPIADRLLAWIDDQRRGLRRQKRQYPTIEAACERLRQEHGFLSAGQAWHLTVHGVRQNGDGSWSWKYDSRLGRVEAPPELTLAQLESLWARIACPVLLAYGTASWASNPEQDGRAAHFPNARTTLFENAGHWLHHEQTDRFVAEAAAFLRAG